MASIIIYGTNSDANISHHDMSDEFLDSLRRQLDAVDGPLWFSMARNDAGYTTLRILPTDRIELVYDRPFDKKKHGGDSDIYFEATGS